MQSKSQLKRLEAQGAPTPMRRRDDGALSPVWQLVTEVKDHQWSMVTDKTERLPVPGGWLYWRTQRESTGGPPRGAMVFVPSVR